jgi:hypothetical protein
MLVLNFLLFFIVISGFYFLVSFFFSILARLVVGTIKTIGVLFSSHSNGLLRFQNILEFPLYNLRL